MQLLWRHTWGHLHPPPLCTHRCVSSLRSPLFSLFFFSFPLTGFFVSLRFGPPFQPGMPPKIFTGAASVILPDLSLFLIANMVVCAFRQAGLTFLPAGPCHDTPAYLASFAQCVEVRTALRRAMFLFIVRARVTTAAWEMCPKRSFFQCFWLITWRFQNGWPKNSNMHQLGPNDTRPSSWQSVKTDSR